MLHLTVSIWLTWITGAWTMGAQTMEIWITRTWFTETTWITTRCAMTTTCTVCRYVLFGLSGARRVVIYNFVSSGSQMTFHVGYCEKILFENWKVSTVGGLVGSMIGIVIMAALYEGLKYYREYLFWKTYNSLQYRSVTVPSEKNVVAEDNRVVQ